MCENLFSGLSRLMLLLAVMMPISMSGQYSRSDRHYNSRFGSRHQYDVASVRLDRSGTLEERLSPDVFKTVRVLHIDGPLNDADIKFIKKICSRSKVVDDRDRSVDNYLDLDLEFATLPSSGRARDNSEVASGLFSYTSHLRSIVLPDRIRVIRPRAFQGCHSLEEVIMPPTVRAIDEKAFQDCSDLSYVWLSNSLEVIGDYAFGDCKRLTNINLPSSLREIGREAFKNVPVRQLDLPNGVELIGRDAFTGTSLTSLLIPASARIENDRLGTMNSLQTIEVARGSVNYSGYQNALYDSRGIVLIQYPAAMSGSCVIPDGVELIAPYAFENCKLSSVQLPESLREFGQGAFYGAAITALDVPDGVRAVPGKMAMRCKHLRSVNLPAQMTAIGNEAFSGCTSLIEIEMPSHMESLGESAFSGCNSLQRIALPDGLTKLSKDAFNNCSSLTAISFPSTLLSIEEKALAYCEKLTNVVLPDRLSIIGKNAFRDCSSITELITPSSLTEIGQEAFRGCSSMSRITLTDGLIRINDNAFRGTPLSRIILPASIKEVGKKIAEKCPNLLRVECHAVTPPTLHKVTNDKVELYVPAQSLEAYKKAKNWKNYKVIKPL